MTMIRFSLRCLKLVPVFIFIIVLNSPQTVFGVSLDTTGTLWAPYLEWSVKNPTFTDNPFDLIATVTFVHNASGEKRITEMFYEGDSLTWKFRFTGTRTGQWNFSTQSDDADLDSLSGTVMINPNPDNRIKGFITHYKSKFARQIGDNGELKAILFNVWQIPPVDLHAWLNDPNQLQSDLDNIINNQMLLHGCNALAGLVANFWFNFGTAEWDDHSSVNPDPRTFKFLEQIITQLNAKSMSLHIWAWGDESRKQTPIGVGGINGIPDKRVQRYIAARLGPLPGWTMGYGYDLAEWVSENQTAEWAKYLHQHMGWDHLLGARRRYNASLDYKSYGREDTAHKYGPGSYNDVVSRMVSNPHRPHLYAERFLFTRYNHWFMKETRQAMWWCVMAGGMGSWWGRIWDGGPPYPNPEQMKTVADFWEDRFLLEMFRDNSLTNGVCLRTPDHENFVFYHENTDSIRMDLRGMNGLQPAIAIDTKLSYSEINLGVLNSTGQSWRAPYISDWAIAVGNFKEDNKK